MFIEYECSVVVKEESKYIKYCNMIQNMFISKRLLSSVCITIAVVSNVDNAVGFLEFWGT